MLEKCREVENALRDAGISVKTDDSDKSPGWKFSEAEMRGIPIRIEIGPRDLEENACVLVRRDTRDKIKTGLNGVVNEVKNLFDTIQKDMFNRAKAHRDQNTFEAHDYDEFKDTIENKPGFVKAMWCGDKACEDKIKEDTTATSRCMPFEQENISDVCVCCGKPAKKLVYWGKAY